MFLSTQVSQLLYAGYCFQFIPLLATLVRLLEQLEVESTVSEVFRLPVHDPWRNWCRHISMAYGNNHCIWRLSQELHERLCLCFQARQLAMPLKLHMAPSLHQCICTKIWIGSWTSNLSIFTRVQVEYHHTLLPRIYWFQSVHSTVSHTQGSEVILVLVPFQATYILGMGD